MARRRESNRPPPATPEAHPALPLSTVDVERAFFDTHAAECGDFDPFTERGWRRLRSALHSLAPPRDCAAMLDVGCGTGRSRPVYTGMYRHYTGIDLSLASVRRARVGQEGDGWVCGDACHLPFADETFDFVAFSSVLHHIPEMLAALQEASRVVRRGGCVFAFDPNYYHPAMNLFRNPRGLFYTPLGVSPNERPLRPIELRRAFAAAGFLDVRQRCQAGISYRYAAPRLINALLGVYNVLDGCVDLMGLGRWIGTFVLTLGKKHR